MATGKYIVIEGNDGTGKTTQVKLLAQYLQSQGKPVIVIEEPGSDDPEHSIPVANSLRDVIKNGSLVRSGETNLLLFTAARRELYMQKILPALRDGNYVLSARNYLSTLAYQGGGEGLDEQLIYNTTRQFVGESYMNPDLTIVLTLSDHNERVNRIGERGITKNPDTFEMRAEDFQNRVNQTYIDLARTLNLRTIDASKDIDTIQREIQTRIKLLV